MTILEHTRELRNRLLLVLGIVLIFFFVFIGFSERILEYLRIPISSLGYELHFLKVHEAFFATVKSAFFAALFLSFPLWIWIPLGFFTPALSKAQKRGLYFTIVLCLLLFFTGFFFSYTILIPISLNYLLGFGNNSIQSTISIGFYLDYFLTLLFVTGVGFQLPVLMFFLVRADLVPLERLRKARKYAVIIILTVSALLTPPDIISQVGLGLPLYILYEAGMLFSFLFGRKKESEPEELQNDSVDSM